MSGPGFSHELRQRQTQSLVLAPQLRQSLKILQVAALDLRSVIQEELQSNPALEELPMDGVSLDGVTDAARESEASNDADNTRDGDSSTADAPPSATLGEEGAKREEMDFSKE